MLKALVDFLLENKEDFTVSWSTSNIAVVSINGRSDLENDLLEFVVKGAYQAHIQDSEFKILCVVED